MIHGVGVCSAPPGPEGPFGDRFQVGRIGKAPLVRCQGGGLSGGPARPKLSPPKLSGVRAQPKLSGDNFPPGQEGYWKFHAHFWGCLGKRGVENANPRQQ